jgi:hypothetical protein
MTMKRYWLLIFIFPFLFSCNQNAKGPDISGIRVDTKIERFEPAFFKIDTIHLSQSLGQLRSAFPDFYPDFMRNILGVSGQPDSATIQVTLQFFRAYSLFAKEIEKKFSDISPTEKEINKSFRYVKYYFPEYKIPKLITYIGTLDAPGIALMSHYIAIGLHQYAGKNFAGYHTREVEDIYPVYVSRRFDAEYIPSNTMKAVVDDLFPDKTTGKPLIEQIIEKGKQWWLLDKFLPDTPDSLKTGYTQKQVQWCRENEGNIWNQFISDPGDLYTIDPSTIQNYIGEGPYTQGMPDSSPGNIGPWIGWQIVKKFVEKNPSLKAREVMMTPASKILEEAKYKPK